MTSKPFYYKGVYYASLTEFIRVREPYFEYVNTEYYAFNQKYNSLREIAKKFNISAETLRKDLKAGKNLESAIKELQEHNKRGITAVDFLGNHFVSLSAMCRFWGIRTNSFFSRFNVGYDIETSIMGKTRNAKAKFIHANKDKFTKEQYNYYINKVTKE